MRLRVAALLLLFCALASTAFGQGSLLIVCYQVSSGCDGAQAKFQALGVFSSVATWNVNGNPNPGLADLTPYPYVLAFTDGTPPDPVGLGSVLAAYYATGGKRLTVATYSFSSPWKITGNVVTGANAALTDVGVNGDVSGSLVQVVSDSIFTGINLGAIVYFHNGNFAHPGLASGATLLATDGAGIDMIARSSSGVVNVNLYPGYNASVNNTALYQLLANTLTHAQQQQTSVPTASPLALAVLICGIAVLALRRLWQPLA